MKISEMLDRLKISKEKREKALIGFLLGVFFLLIATPASSFSPKKKEKNADSAKSAMRETEQIQNENLQTSSYIRDLENKLEQTIGGMEGAGRVSVMITVKDNGELVLDKNRSYENETENETSDGKSKEKNRMKNEPETVLIEEGGDTAPIVVQQRYPVIEGVVVVCDGGDNSRVAMNIKEAVQALFSIDAHKIVVCKSQTKL